MATKQIQQAYEFLKPQFPMAYIEGTELFIPIKNAAGVIVIFMISPNVLANEYDLLTVKPSNESSYEVEAFLNFDTDVKPLVKLLLISLARQTIEEQMKEYPE